MNFEDRRSAILALGFAPGSFDTLKAYVNHLWTANEELNLFSRQMTYSDLLDNHIIDCLLPLSLFPKDTKNVADLGSGGGLPGIIYALQFPEITFSLFEKSAKKREFLESCQKMAPNIKIFGEIPKDLAHIDLITARGFKPLDVIIEMTQNYFKLGGKYFLLKGRREKIEEEYQQSLLKFKKVSIQVLELKSPVLQVERHLVLL